MRNKFNEDFDLQVRSMMDQAQEPAPAGAWEAISGRLDAMAAASAAAASSASASAGSKSVLAGLFGTRRVWYWAGAALAMAAAVALGIFFSGTSDNNSNLININSGEALVAEAVAPAETPAVSETPVASETPAQTQKASVVSLEPRKSASQTQIEPVASLEIAETAETAETAEAAEIAKPVETVSTEPSNVEPAKPAIDPFAQMAFEDAHKAAGKTVLSLLLMGGASGNNAGSGKVFQGAPGTYLQSGITETSKSSFGIPVVAGIGIRLHLTDALAIGTGLDYSLLTRSFEGKYTEGTTTSNGDFNHTLQYIGIPVDLFVKLVQKDDITLYSTVGTEAEYAVSNKYRLLGTNTVVGDKVNGLQWSVGGGFGLEFNPGNNFGIFAEPTFKYYFNCDQPKSLRTDKPFQMILRVGVRFEL